MSMPPQKRGAIPEETARIARTAFRKGTLAMRLRDVLGAVYTDQDVDQWYPGRGQPADTPWRLAVVTIWQYAENLTDRQAAEAVRGRIDWKDGLGLELSDEDLDASVLSEWRQRLAQQGKSLVLLERLLEISQQRGWIKAGGKQRTESTHVLAGVRSLSNLEGVGETLRAALNALAEQAPDWLVQHARTDWFERSSHRVENARLPKAEKQRVALAPHIGDDGWQVLQALAAPDAPEGLANIEQVQVLPRVWQPYSDLSCGTAHWRAGPQVGSGDTVVRSPYDPEAVSGQQRETVWLGSNVHVTETCDEGEGPHLMTDVQTTLASITDWERTAQVQDPLVQRDLKPADHLVETGDVTAEHVVRSRQQEITLVGSVMPDTTWQAREGHGFTASSFHLDWQATQAICPQGKVSQFWWKGESGVPILFAKADGATCPVRAPCTKSVRTGRMGTRHSQQAHEAS
ncbi:MAG TPA: transposase [Ktedonobacteraceae bacterium]|jgi:transposase